MSTLHAEGGPVVLTIDADVAVISSCCVTNEALAKSRKGPRQARGPTGEVGPLSVHGHEKVPTGGHLEHPLVAM